MSNNRTAINNQLVEYLNKHKAEKTPRATTTSGWPVAEKDASLTVGKRGVVLLQDVPLIDEMAQFDRERIPERVVHAKGAGAFGYFEVTHDITQYTAAKVFSEIGKRTEIAVRFSQVTGEMGSADTVRDPRGFAVKFYTEDGAWDLVGNNTPIFFIRDSILFPSFIHVLKRNPVTHVRDPDMFWDFISLRPETTHQILILYSDRGIPDGYRHMHGYGSNTFSFINKEGALIYCKFHYLTNQGIRNIDADRATILAGQDPDYSLRDLYNAIENKNYPTWRFCIQVMTVEQAEKSPFDPFDVTQVWPHAQYPLIDVGTLTLNRNPSNYFAEVEQMALNPANLVPGIDVSPDRMLQGRLFSYGDTHRYRLGKNYNQLPVNSPQKTARVANYSRDGFATIDSQNGAPIYHPNSFKGPDSSLWARQLTPAIAIQGEANRYDNGGQDNFTQARVLYQRVLDDGAKERLIRNLANDIRGALPFIQANVLKNFEQVDAVFARRIAENIRQINEFNLGGLQHHTIF